MKIFLCVSLGFFFVFFVVVFRFFFVLFCFFFCLFFFVLFFFFFVPCGKSSVSSLGCFCCFFFLFKISCWDVFFILGVHSFTCSGFANVVFKGVFFFLASRSPMWGLKVFSVEVTNVGLEGFYEGQWLRARLCCRKISDSIFWLYYFTPHVVWLAQCLAQRRSKRNIQKEKIRTDRRRKHFFHTFLYLLGEWTNQRYVPKHSVVSKTPDSKIGVVGSTSLPEKRGRFTENLSIYLSLPAPNSLLQNSSNFGATASHWLLYILLFFFFLILKPDGCVEPYAWQRVYTFCIWQPMSQYPVGSFYC